MKHVFKYYGADFLGYLNMIGFTLLFYCAVLTITILKKSLPSLTLSSLISTLITLAGTYHSVRITLPYDGKKQSTFYLRPFYLYKHLFLVLKEVYCFQFLTIIIGILVLLLVFPEQGGWIGLSIVTISIYWLSVPLVYTYQIIGRILHLSTLLCMYIHNANIIILLLFLNIINILANFSLEFDFLMPIDSLRINKKTVDNTLFNLALQLMRENLPFFTLVIAIFSTITYFVQKWFLTFDNSNFHIPFFFLSISTFITLLETIVGKDIRELAIDKDLLILHFLNSKISVYRAYRSSQSLLLAHVYAFIHIASILVLIPLILHGQIVLFLSNLLMIPFIYFISFCYFVKSSRIISRDLSIFKWVFLILYFLLISIAMAGNRV